MGFGHNEADRYKKDVESYQSSINSKIAEQQRSFDKVGSMPIKQDDWYPGKSYQRLFDMINEVSPNSLESQMQDIVRIVHEDFPIQSLTVNTGDGWVKVEDLAITASEMEWPDEVMGMVYKLATPLPPVQ